MLHCSLSSSSLCAKSLLIKSKKRGGGGGGRGYFDDTILLLSVCLYRFISTDASNSEKFSYIPFGAGMSTTFTNTWLLWTPLGHKNVCVFILERCPYFKG